MEELIIDFIKTYGLPLGLIALGGVILLCVLKYGNLFKKLAENWRHVLYLAIAIGFSLVASAVYLAATGQFSVEYFFAISAAIFTLDQAIYAVIKATTLNDLMGGLFDKLRATIKKKTVKAAEPVAKTDKSGTDAAPDAPPTVKTDADEQTHKN